MFRPQAERKETFPASAANALMGWVLIIKDLVRRVSTVLDEAEPMHLTVHHLQETFPEADRGPGGDGRLLPFSKLSSRLDAYIDRLRGLQAGLRRELLVLEVLLLDCPYTDAVKGTSWHTQDDPIGHAAAALVDVLPDDRTLLVRSSDLARKVMNVDAWLTWFRELPRLFWSLSTGEWRYRPNAELPPGLDAAQWHEALLDLERLARARAMADVLARVARYRIGASPEDQDFPASRLHEDLLLRTSQHSAELGRLLVTHERISQALQQRSALLPTWFPRIPRLHRRGRYENDRALYMIMLSTRELVLAFIERNLTAAVRKPRLEVVYAYVMTSSIHHAAPEDSHGSVILSVPFMYLDLPRYAANMAHELAHAILPEGAMEGLLSDDAEAALEAIQGQQWIGDQAAAIREAGQALHQLFEDFGLPQPDHSMLIEEALADYIALRVIGPHFPMSLMAALISVVRLPHPHEDRRERGVELHNPITRLAALVEYESWHSEPRGDERDVLGWDPARLDAVKSVVDAYFTMFEHSEARSGQWSDDARLARIWRGEIEIYVRMFLELDRGGMGRAGYRRRKGPDLPEHVLNALRAAYGEDMPEEVVLSGVGPARDLTVCDQLHLVWDHTLRQFQRRVAAYQVAAAEVRMNSDSTAPKKVATEELQQALWTRESEVRLLLSLLNAEVPWFGKEVHVVSHYAIDLFWDEPTPAEGQFPTGWASPAEIAAVRARPSVKADTLQPRILWALGHYDVHLLVRRFHGWTEDLKITSAPYRGAIALRREAPSFFIRTEDFVVVEAASAEDGEVVCFVRRWTRKRLDVDSLQPRLVLRSFGYVPWAEEYVPATIDDIRLIAGLPDLASLGLLYGGGPNSLSAALGDLVAGPSAELLCSFAVRMRLLDTTRRQPDRAPKTQLADRIGTELDAVRSSVSHTERGADVVRFTSSVASDLDGLDLRIDLFGQPEVSVAAPFRIYAHVAGRVARAVGAHDVNTTLLFPHRGGRPASSVALSVDPPDG